MTDSEVHIHGLFKKLSEFSNNNFVDYIHLILNFFFVMLVHMSTTYVGIVSHIAFLICYRQLIRHCLFVIFCWPITTP